MGLGKRFLAGFGCAAFAGMLLAHSGTAYACTPDATVTFREGAPTDRFIISNDNASSWTLVSMAIVLRGSIGRLIFDTEEGGDGSSVFQPFRSGGGTVTAEGVIGADDGSEELAIAFQNFGPGHTYMFTIDLDDRLEMSQSGQTIITGAEIAGATIEAEFVDTSGMRFRSSGMFREDAVAILTHGACG